MGNTMHDIPYMRKGLKAVDYDLLVKVRQNNLEKDDIQTVTINNIQVTILYLWLLLDYSLSEFLRFYSKHYKITTQSMREINVFKQNLTYSDYYELLNLVGNTNYYESLINTYFETEGLPKNVMDRIEELFLTYMIDLKTVIMYKNKYKWHNEAAVTNKINNYLGPLSVTYDLKPTSSTMVNLVILVLFVMLLITGLLISILNNGGPILFLTFASSLYMLFIVHYKHFRNFIAIMTETY